MLKNIKKVLKLISKNKNHIKKNSNPSTPEIIYRDRIVEKKIYLKEPTIATKSTNSLYLENQYYSKSLEKFKNHPNNFDIVTELHHKGDEIKNCILEAFKNAKKEIKVVVPWLSDKDIIEILNLKNSEIPVHIIISNESSNDISNFYTKNIKVVNRWGSKGSNRLHDKFCIVDNKYILCGSFNYSRNAISNEEFIVKLEGTKIINDFNNLYSKLSKLK